MNNASKIYLDQVAIGKRIMKIRKIKGVSIDDICQMMDNISPQAVYKWQRGSCLPDIENLLNLSILLGTTIEDILLGEETDDEVSSFLHQRIYYVIFNIRNKAKNTINNNQRLQNKNVQIE